MFKSQEKAAAIMALGPQGQSGQFPPTAPGGLFPSGGGPLVQHQPGGFFGSGAPSQGNGLLEKLGGVDGIIKTVENVQNMMQMLQRIAPIWKLISSLVGKAKQKSAGASRKRSYSRNRRVRYRPPQRRKNSLKRAGASGKNRKYQKKSF